MQSFQIELGQLWAHRSHQGHQYAFHKWCYRSLANPWTSCLSTDLASGCLTFHTRATVSKSHQSTQRAASSYECPLSYCKRYPSLWNGFWNAGHSLPSSSWWPPRSSSPAPSPSNWTEKDRYYPSTAANVLQLGFGRLRAPRRDTTAHFQWWTARLYECRSPGPPTAAQQTSFGAPGSSCKG